MLIAVCPRCGAPGFSPTFPGAVSQANGQGCAICGYHDGDPDDTVQVRRAYVRALEALDRATEGVHFVERRETVGQKAENVHFSISAEKASIDRLRPRPATAQGARDIVTRLVLLQDNVPTEDSMERVVADAKALVRGEPNDEGEKPKEGPWWREAQGISCKVCGSFWHPEVGGQKECPWCGAENAEGGLPLVGAGLPTGHATLRHEQRYDGPNPAPKAELHIMSPKKRAAIEALREMAKAVESATDDERIKWDEGDNGPLKGRRLTMVVVEL